MYVAFVANLVNTYLTRGNMTQFEYGTSRDRGATYPPYLVLYHTACSIEKGISTLKGLEA